MRQGVHKSHVPTENTAHLRAAAPAVDADTDRLGRARVEAHAAALGLSIELVIRPAAASLVEAAGLLGITPADIVKTLVVKRKVPQEAQVDSAPGAYLFVLIPGDRQISWPKLRALLGVNKLSLPDAALALEATGYERGSITPLGSTTAWPVFADASIVGRRISIGAGEHGSSAFVDADALLTALNATVADISDVM